MWFTLYILYVCLAFPIELIYIENTCSCVHKRLQLGGNFHAIFTISGAISFHARVCFQRNICIHTLLFCYQSVDTKTNQYNQNLPLSGCPGWIASLGVYCHSLSGRNKHQVSVVQSRKIKELLKLHFTKLKHGTNIQNKHFFVPVSVQNHSRWQFLKNSRK